MSNDKTISRYHVRSKLTGARVVIDVDRSVAESECKRLNREAETGERAAYGRDDDRVEAERLVAEGSGHNLTSVVTFPEGAALSDADLLAPSLVGRILHRGEAMEYEVEVEKLTIGEDGGAR